MICESCEIGSSQMRTAADQLSFYVAAQHVRPVAPIVLSAPPNVTSSCKIWSSGSSGRLRARFFDLEVDATLAPDDQQIPPVPVRPDPRGT